MTCCLPALIRMLSYRETPTGAVVSCAVDPAWVHLLQQPQNKDTIEATYTFMPLNLR